MTENQKSKLDGVEIGKVFYLYSLWLDKDHICPTCEEEVGSEESFYCILDVFDINRAVEVFLRRKENEVFCEFCIEINSKDKHGRGLLEREFMSRIWNVEPREPSSEEGLLGVLIVRVLMPRKVTSEIERIWNELEDQE
jgi:hypothetical protein